MLGREYVLTYRPTLEANETIVAGKMWDPTPATEPEVSIAEEIKGLQGLDVGSTITLDIVGRKLTARVTSVRRVDWRKARTGFLILFRPNVLDNAPTMYVGGLNGPADDLSRSRLQRTIVENYPNVSIIDVGEVIQLVTRLLGNVSLGVTFIGGFVFFSGTLILIGSVAMTKYQRAYEAALLKTLGATRKIVLTIVVAEYGLLGLIAGLIGSAAALALSYSMTRFLFEIPGALHRPSSLAESQAPSCWSWLLVCFRVCRHCQASHSAFCAHPNVLKAPRIVGVSLRGHPHGRDEGDFERSSRANVGRPRSAAPTMSCSVLSPLPGDGGGCIPVRPGSPSTPAHASKPPALLECGRVVSAISARGVKEVILVQLS